MSASCAAHFHFFDLAFRLCLLNFCQHHWAQEPVPEQVGEEPSLPSTRSSLCLLGRLSSFSGSVVSHIPPAYIAEKEGNISHFLDAWAAKASYMDAYIRGELPVAYS